jgi:hypothetical protein
VRIKLPGAGWRSRLATVIGQELGHTGQTVGVGVVYQFAPQLARITAVFSPALEEIGLIRVELAARANLAARLVLRINRSLNEFAHRLAVQANGLRDGAQAHATLMAFSHQFKALSALLASLLRAER